MTKTNMLIMFLFTICCSISETKGPIENPPFTFHDQKEDGIKMFLDTETPDDSFFKSSISLETTLENYPNPFVHPALCNRSGMKYSYICDPNKILSRKVADQIEEILNYQRFNSYHYCEEKGDVPYL